MNDFTHIDLFSGIGGFAIAAGWAGFRTIVFCEIDEFCQEVLKARFGAVENPNAIRCVHREYAPRESKVGDERNIGPRNENWFHHPTLIPDIRNFDGTRWRGTTLLTGGFPCQPFSVAGKRRGKEDDRHLWPEMLRVIHEARPTWVVGENVAGIVNMELEQVCADLEAEGYEVQPVVIPACAVNAPHRRDRVWIIAHDSQDTIERRNGGRGDGDTPELRRPLQVKGPDSDAPDTEREGLSESESGELTKRVFHAERGNSETLANPKFLRCQVGGWMGDGERMGQEQERTYPSESGWDIPWIEVATRLCRVDDGLPTWVHSRRVARLKALGNSIVPQVAYEIIKGIAEIERG